MLTNPKKDSGQRTIGANYSNVEKTDVCLSVEFYLKCRIKIDGVNRVTNSRKNKYKNPLNICMKG